MTQLKTFLLNGKFYCTNDVINLSDLLLYFNYNESLLVLEYNSSICSKKLWNTVFIENNDKIEIVTIVGGG